MSCAKPRAQPSVLGVAEEEAKGEQHQHLGLVHAQGNPTAFKMVASVS